MTDAEALALAQAAARHWGTPAKPPRLINNRENAVFELRLQDGTRGALRLHRAGYQSDASIRSELTWTEGLARGGFPCPAPIRTLDGALLACAGTAPRASFVGWIDAPPLGAQGQDWPGTLAQQARAYHALGALTARLHRASDALALPPEFTRPAWDREALTGSDPLWGRYWLNPALSTEESALLLRARDAARERLAAPGWDTGLIHADLLQENVLHRDGALWLIDFDDGGTGYRLYDLGTALIQHHESAAYPALAEALCDGYGADPSEVALFVLLRALASAGWIVPRAAPGDPRLRFYAARAIACTRAYLAREGR